MACQSLPSITSKSTNMAHAMDKDKTETNLNAHAPDEDDSSKEVMGDTAETEIDLHDLVNAIIDDPDFWNGQGVDNM